MTLRLRGNAWYLKKTVQVKGKSVRREFPLKVFGGEPARKQAEAAAKKLEKDIDRANATAGVMAEFGIKQQDTDDTQAPTLKAWWEKVKTLYSVDHHPRVETWLALPFGSSTWGQTAIDQFKKTDCLAALAARRKQHRRTRAGKPSSVLVSEATVQKERGLIQAVFQRAVADEIIAANAWLGISKPSGPVGRRNDDGSHRILEPGDEKAFVNELKPRYARAARFLLLTGIRAEGLLGLKPEHVRQMRDGRVYAHVAEKSADHNQTCPVCKRVGKKCREVPMVQEAQEIVKQQVEADGELWSGLTRHVLFNHFVEAAVAAKINRITPHDLRFTFGHRYMVAGGQLQDLSRILGHSTVAITEKHYAYLKPSDLADKLTAVMEPGKPKGKMLKLVATSR